MQSKVPVCISRLYLISRNKPQEGGKKGDPCADANRFLSTSFSHQRHPRSFAHQLHCFRISLCLHHRPVYLEATGSFLPLPFASLDPKLSLSLQLLPPESSCLVSSRRIILDPRRANVRLTFIAKKRDISFVTGPFSWDQCNNSH